MVMAVAVMSHHAKLAGGDLRRVQLPHGRGKPRIRQRDIALVGAFAFRGCHGVAARAEIGEGEKMIERCDFALQLRNRFLLTAAFYTPPAVVGYRYR